MDVTKPSRFEEIRLKLRSELGPQQYSSVDLRSYTSNLSNKIGFGGYGEVYKGLHDGVSIAVKVLKNNDVTDNTFLAEVCILEKASHRNVVKFYGYCFEDNMKALVFEYMENGSLDKILYKNHHPRIEWVMLYDIAIDIAKGVRYLHEDMDRQIIHHDIKPGNVLLDKNFSAKIIDFGLAKSINRDVSRVTLSRERGTFGYNAPETWMPNSQVTSRCDVYSFGMMLFEILGKRNNGLEKNWFPGIVWNQFKSEKLQQLIEEYGIKETDKEKAIRLSKVALWCVQLTPELRPSMEDVVLMLQDKKLIEDPPYPSFLGLQDSTSQVISEECRADNEREKSDSQERGYPQNIIADQTDAPIAGGYCGDSLLTQLREDVKCKKIRTTKLVGKTALNYSEMILKWILKDEAVTFCINGMGGVGKTTIMDDIYNQLIAKDLKRNQKHFDKIIWVSVSKDDNFIELLQKDLAEELEIKLPSDDVLKRSRVLSQALEKRKKVVLFLDDIWKEISLDEIGIPEPTLENGCKLLFTTRKLDMSRRMRCHKTITVEPLPEDEAWDLFMKKVNYVLTPEVRKVAEMVAKKCSGLPLAIITVGKAMSDEKYSDIEYWTGALNELNLKDPSNETMEMEMENVYKCLKFSYDRLGNDKQKKCFLCCALYPESREIVKRNLFELWIMDGMVEGINRQDELFKCRYILNKLKDHCLLETVNKVYDRGYDEISDGVKMHDLIRDMALRLKKKCFMVKDGPSLRELPNEEEWVDLKKASFMHNQIEALSISPICPNLSILILEGTYLKSVSHDFFVHMKCLKVLDLQCDPELKNEDLKLLPDSISDLVNLRVLRLSWYKKLKKLPSLAKLVSLRLLELNNTGIEELPEGMERLGKLRCLNLHWVQLKERIPFGLISKLFALQELYLGGIEVDKLYELGKGESFAEELLSLKKLENLSVSFHWLSDYASYVGSTRFKGLTCFNLSIGGMLYSQGCYLGIPPHATVQICYPADKHTAPFFPQNTKRVEAELFHDVIRLNELGWLIKDVEKLIAFSVFGFDKMECIWSSKQNEKFSATGTSSICWLQSLEKIQIVRCPKLYTLFEGIPISLGVFCLKDLIIHNCNSLKNVFPSSRLLQLFPKLERVIVIGCGEIEELIGDDEENRNIETPIAIPSLKHLWFLYLPKLKRICRGVIICYSLERILVQDCLELKSLPQLKGEDHLTPPSTLRQINGSRKWWNSLEWDPVYPQNILQPFFIALERKDSKQSSQLNVNVHIGIGCDNCEMVPIVGKRYKCKDCYNEGFDLCENCYNTPSKRIALVNHHQRKGHTFELIANRGDSPVPVNPDDSSVDTEGFTLNEVGVIRASMSEELPEWMERLVNLRCLNLHGVQLKERIPFGLLSKLSALQELYLGGIEVDKLYEVGKGESFAEELLSLKKLENLSVSFHQWSDYASYVGSPRFKGLTCFFLSIGGMLNTWEKYLGDAPHATVRICYPVVDKYTNFFPQNTKCVEVESFLDVIRLDELGWLIRDVTELVAFSVSRCDRMECMWSSKQTESSICWLQSLETIHIKFCPKLYTIVEGIPISLVVFCLKELTITRCNNLKNVFPSSKLLQLFPKLEKIIVWDCYEIEELIGDGEEYRNTETPITIPSLKELWIWGLPKLKRIYKGVMICYSLETIFVTNCLELKRLPQLKGEDRLTPPSALRLIYGSKEWWDSLEWDTAYPQNILQPFFIEQEDVDLGRMLLLENEDSNSQSDGEDFLSVGEDSQTA